jgi:hypothetical protein
VMSAYRAGKDSGDDHRRNTALRSWRAKARGGVICLESEVHGQMAGEAAHRSPVPGVGSGATRDCDRMRR